MIWLDLFVLAVVFLSAAGLGIGLLWPRTLADTERRRE